MDDRQWDDYLRGMAGQTVDTLAGKLGGEHSKPIRTPPTRTDRTTTTPVSNAFVPSSYDSDKKPCRADKVSSALEDRLAGPKTLAVIAIIWLIGTITIQQWLFLKIPWWPGTLLAGAMMLVPAIGLWKLIVDFIPDIVWDWVWSGDDYKENDSRISFYFIRMIIFGKVGLVVLPILLLAWLFT